MNTVVFRPIAAELRSLSVTDLSAGSVAGLRGLLAEHGVLVMPGQSIDDEQFVAFLRSFGDLAFTTGEAGAPGFPDLNVVSNVGRTTPPRSTFHVDTSYVRRPPAYTALRAVTIPAEGGETLFTNQYRAYDTLPGSVRDLLVGETITHVATGVSLGEDDETSAEHPVLRRHPLSGKVALYLTTPSRCRAISGMSDEVARELIAFLFEHSTREDNIYRHRWSPGDVVIWDNGCVLHRADHAHVVGDRVMHRGMVAGYGLGAAAPMSRS
jgi:taurine dioxygenase